MQTNLAMIMAASKSCKDESKSDMWHFSIISSLYSHKMAAFERRIMIIELKYLQKWKKKWLATSILSI